MVEGRQTPATADIPVPQPVDTLPTAGVTPRRRARSVGLSALAAAGAVGLAAIAPGAAAASTETRTPFYVPGAGPDTYMGMVVPGQELIFHFDPSLKVNTNVGDSNSRWVGAEGNRASAQGDKNCKRDKEAPTGATIVAIVNRGRIVLSRAIVDGSRVHVTEPGAEVIFNNDTPPPFIENGVVKICGADNGGGTGGVQETITP